MLRKPHIIPLLLMAIVGAGLFFLSPNSGCPIRSTTSLHCPGCGGKRALSQLSQGNFLTSLQSNLLLIPALLMILWLLISLIGNGKIRQIHITKRASIALLILVATYTAVRNLESIYWLRP